MKKRTKRMTQVEGELVALLRGSISKMSPELRALLFRELDSLNSKPFHAIATVIDVIVEIHQNDGVFKREKAALRKAKGQP